MLLNGLSFCLLICGTTVAALGDHDVSLCKTKTSVLRQNDTMEGEGIFEPLDQPAIGVYVSSP